MLVGKVLLAVLSMLALAGGASAQCTGTQFNCQTFEATNPDVGSLTLNFQYDSAGNICTVNQAQITTPCPSTAATGCGLAQAFAVTPATGSKTTVRLVNGQYEATNINIGVTFPTYTANQVSGTNGQATLGLVDGRTNVQTAPLAQLVFTPFGINTAIVAVTDQTDNCQSLTFGDPHFEGFGGQKYSVFGKPGNVMNILSASNMQLNARLVQLNVGDSITDAEQQVVKKASSAALPKTHAFDYAGPYMGELGLATLAGRTLYAKAGHYADGWAEVTLDGAEWNEFGKTVVIGERADAIAITRPNPFEIVIESKYVHLTVSNSDLFFNIENAHLERLADKKRRPYGGALGQSAKLGWEAKMGDTVWQQQMEADCKVESGDLFELTAQQ